ncbi:ABC transporter substrate-binding protein [Oceanibacterium hippocampi]|uniref:Periplasmic dipeptide transport protein n=1 Tax=Oceanibacterium hippocampi TaxID=745714 RepID=A0A1Y5RTV0_9PROT|nr:ABC transporter substrate-binding protein [Oceanibacterium hippocampi]SLN24153.1 Periplasmic dipeptide transport protein precursor [Oceanibacterium hippocampi]
MTKISNRDRLRLIGGLGAFSAMNAIAVPAAVLGGSSAASAQGQRTLSWSVNPEPPSLNAAFTSASIVQQVSSKMMEGLCTYDHELNPLPGLAKSWEISPNGETIVFKLREGVKWHDGKPFTSADVKFTFEEILKKRHPRGRATYANLEAVETPDAMTAVFKLSGPSPYIMSSLAGAESPILPKHIYDKADPSKVREVNAPIGTGPFKFVNWERGSHLMLERNPDYWDAGKPGIDQLIVRFIPDTGARVVAFETGELDLAGGFPVGLDDIVRLSKEPNIGVTSFGFAMLGAMHYFEFNMRDPQFQDVRVRQAMAHAIDRDFLIKNVWFGFASAATGPVSQKLANSYSADVPAYPFDPARAEALLDEAGFPRKDDGIRFRITHDPSPYNDRFKRFGEYFKQAMATIGVAVDLRIGDVGTWLRRVWTDNDYQTTSYGIYNTTDPSIGVQRMYWSKNIRKGVPYTNGSGYSNPEMDRIMEAAQVEPDPMKRKALFADMQRKAMTDLPIIPILNEDYVTVYNKRVQNVEGDVAGVYGTFADISIAS